MKNRTNGALRKKPPCQIKGYSYPPKMIQYTEFAKKYFFSRYQVRTMIDKSNLFCLKHKNRLFVCPNPLCYEWTKEQIADFWQ